ncbi:MAG: GNAT family protein [Chitinophagaceae bacterium]
MSSNIPYKGVLIGRLVQLEKFNDEHIEPLGKIARDERIWAHLPYSVSSDESFEQYILQLKTDSDKGLRVAYVARNKSTNEVCGCTSFLNIDKENRKLEIGGTWFNPAVWGTRINTESKLLLLTYCFEELHIMRAELVTRESNIRSQKAIEKAGGVKEGLIRCHRINPDGTFRNTVLYSFIQPEWPATKMKLQQLLLA